MHNLFKDFFGLTPELLQSLFKNSTYPWEVLEQLEMLIHQLPLGQHRGFIDSKATIRNPQHLYLGEESEIGPGVLIEGPVFLANRVKIKHGAYIRGPVFIDEGCVVGHATEVKHSIFFKKASAAHFNYVGNSILGEGVQLGAGATCANLRFDKQEIIVRFSCEKIVTTHKKMGALIGWGAQMGCQSVLSPGCVVAPQSIIHPLANVQGYYDRK